MTLVIAGSATTDVELGGYRLWAKNRILFSPFALNRDPPPRTAICRKRYYELRRLNGSC